MISSFSKGVAKDSVIVYSPCVKRVAFKIYNVSVCLRIDIKSTRLLFHYTSQSHHIISICAHNARLTYGRRERSSNGRNRWLQPWLIWREHVFGVNQTSGILMVSFVFFSSFARALCDRYDFPMIQNVFKKSRHTWKGHYTTIINPLFQWCMHIFCSKNTAQLTGYPGVLFVKTTNKEYIFSVNLLSIARNIES